MQEQSYTKTGDNFEHSPLPSPAFSPLGHIPLTSHLARRFGEERMDSSFFSSLGQALANGKIDTPYPWKKAPALWVIQEGALLCTDAQGQHPLDASAFFNLPALAQLTLAEQTRAVLIYAGEINRQAQAQPVLVVISELENYLKDKHPVFTGHSGEEISAASYLAQISGGYWVPARTLAETEYASGQAEPDSHSHGELMVAALALASWHRSARFDPASGEETLLAQAGWSRTTGSGRELFPRTDPAVITAVTALHQGHEKLLLGSARAWEENRFSTFAGFVEAGESLESAVARELLEECGAQVESMQYMGSQPWPFPRSLMLGFRAVISNPQTVKADGQEIREIRWFTRAELLQALDTQEVVLPSHASISRKLIDDFLYQHRASPQSD